VLTIVTFVNKAMKTGVVIRASLVLRKEGDSKQGYYMQWREFNKLDVTTHAYVYEDEAHTLAVPGNSTITRQIWFDFYDPSFVLEAGTYIVTLCFWTEQNAKGKPKQESCKLIIDASLYAKLEAYRKTRKSNTLEVPLKGELPTHKLMNNNELENSLGIWWNVTDEK